MSSDFVRVKKADPSTDATHEEEPVVHSKPVASQHEKVINGTEEIQAVEGNGAERASTHERNGTGKAQAKVGKDTDETLVGEEATPKASPTAPTANAVPDGGRTAWLTVLGCFLAFFASFGFTTGYGVFQAYYEVILPNHSSDDIAWIGSFQIWAVVGLAIPSAILNAHFGPQITLGLGTFLIVFGVMMASISKEYYQFLLSHGVCTGLGIGLTFIPLVGLPNQWFSTKRGVAVGISLGGASVGGVIWPVMFNQMINYDRVGYSWSMRAIGFIQVATMAGAIALIRSNVPLNKTIKLSSFHTPFLLAIKSVGVVLFAIALLLHFFGIYIPYFFAPTYAQSLGASSCTAFWLSAVLSAATFFGRFVMGGLSDRLGHGNMLIFCVFISAMLAFAWQGVISNAGMFVWVFFYGWFSGASVSLQSPGVIPLVPEPKLRLIGPYIAILCQFSSFGNLGGPPIAGRLLRNRVVHFAARRMADAATSPTGGRGSASSQALSLAQPEDSHPMMWFVGSILLGSSAFYFAARSTYQRKLFAKA